MAYSYIFIGSTHSFIDDFSKQKEVINSINPEFVLSEELENLKLDSNEKFRKILEKRHISEMTPFGEIENLIKLCFEKNINLIGIDFHNFGLGKSLRNKIKHKIKLTKEEEEELNKIARRREEYHLTKILEYKEKTDKPMVVILGCWHLRRGSLIRKNLKNYKIIAPIDEHGEVLFEPSRERKIKYGEIVSNG